MSHFVMFREFCLAVFFRGFLSCLLPTENVEFSFPVPVALKSVHAHWCVMGKYSWQDGGR